MSSSNASGPSPTQWAEQARVCQGCGHQILGAAVFALGACWHPRHFACAGCGKAIAGDFYEHSRRPYHEACHRVMLAPRCAACGKPLLGSHLVDHWGSKLCTGHELEYPACRYCGRLVPPHQQGGSATSTDGIRCPVCRSTAIEIIAQAQPIFAHLVRWINDQGLYFNNLNLRIELRNRVQLADFLNDHGNRDALGATMRTTYSRPGAPDRTIINGVAILRGLPAALFQGVAVHELGHAWLAVHGVRNLPAWAEEGCCELLSHRYYTQLDTPEARYHAICIQRNQDLVYGAGFRRVEELARRVGFPQLIDSLKNKGELPCR